LPRYVGDNEGWEIPGDRVAGETLFRPEPEPLGRNYLWADELERHRVENFWPRGRVEPRAPRPAFVRRSLKRF
jgi:hypothetical protein